MVICNWLVRAYSAFGDIDKYLILINLVNRQFIFLRKNGLVVEFDNFFADKPIEIDKINILQASLLAMKRAIKKLKKKPSHVLIDGNKVPNLKNYNLKAIIKGDQKIPSISAASIIAKVSRDKFLTTLARNNKGYGWEQNFGYGTKQHLKAIKKLGINNHHRKTFSPISRLKTHNI